MKIIGLIGGMSWESTVSYYQIINETVKRQLGGLHSARCILYSVDFHEIEECQSRGDWAKSAQILSAAARSLERAGAELIVICTNTMHKVAGEIGAAVSVPLLHIAEVTARALLEHEIRRVALLGTKYTMEQDFYKGKLAESGIEVMLPEAADREWINDLIFKELCLGVVSPAARTRLLEIIDRLAERGARAAILGCTELGLLVRQEDTPVPLFDTAEIHAFSAAMISLADESGAAAP